MESASSSVAAGDATHNPNLPFIECWNEILTPKWIRFRHLLSGNGKIHSDVAYPQLGIQRGHRVLDVACGFGENSLELAERVGPDGSVVGLDCTREFIEIAQREREAAQVHNLTYQLGDIETAPLPEQTFDIAVSRFGIMYCQSPVRALRRIAKTLKPGGQVGLIAWRKLAENPCWAIAEEVALRHLPAPGEGAKTCGPGPFSMGDRETDERIMGASGFEDVQLTQIDRDVCLGRTLDEAVDYQMLVGPAGFILREAGERGAQYADIIQREMREAYRPYRREDGSVWVPSSTWFVRGRTPRSDEA